MVAAGDGASIPVDAGVRTDASTRAWLELADGTRPGARATERSRALGGPTRARCSPARWPPTWPASAQFSLPGGDVEAGPARLMLSGGGRAAQLTRPSRQRATCGARRWGAGEPGRRARWCADAHRRARGAAAGDLGRVMTWADRDPPHANPLTSARPAQDVGDRRGGSRRAARAPSRQTASAPWRWRRCRSKASITDVVARTKDRRIFRNDTGRPAGGRVSLPRCRPTRRSSGWPWRWTASWSNARSSSRSARKRSGTASSATPPPSSQRAVKEEWVWVPGPWAIRRSSSGSRAGA